MFLWRNKIINYDINLNTFLIYSYDVCKTCAALLFDSVQVIINYASNPCPAEPRYVLPLQRVQIQISWLLKKPTDLDMHCLPFSMWIFINHLDQVIWLAEN